MIAYINHIPRVIFEQGVIHSGRSRAGDPKFAMYEEIIPAKVTSVSIHLKIFLSVLTNSTKCDILYLLGVCISHLHREPLQFAAARAFLYATVKRRHSVGLLYCL